MHKDRLLKTAEYLDTVVRSTPALFDMGVWATKFESQEVCGTAACAFGHACSIPEFQEAGLVLGTEKVFLGRDRLVPTLVVESGTHPDHPANPKGIEAAKQFYGITMDEAEYLFTPERYEDDDKEDGEVTLDAVVYRLRHFAETGLVTTFEESYDDD